MRSPRVREGIWYYAHTPNERSDCGLILYHGGGGVFGSAQEMFHVANRYAVDTKCIVFNVEYRLAPEFNIEQGDSGIYDAYNAAIDIKDEIDAGRWNIDSNRVAYLGESGGGWIAGAVGL
jgi:acetyl esterase